MRHASEHSAALSVVFAARGGLVNTRKVIACLLEQSIAPRLELIVISDRPELLREIEGVVRPCGRFARCEFLHSVGHDLADDRILGATRATAAFVAFTEDHAFPDQLWAEEIVAAFESSEHVLAAAPWLLNPNPDSAVSRAQFSLTHGFVERGGLAARFEDRRHLPWHATAYRTAMLRAEIAAGPADLFRVEGFLQERLRHIHPRGRLVRCTRTRTSHVNMSRLGPALRLAFHGGRMFAAVRAERRGWGPATRAARSLAFPMVAVLKMLRAAPVLWDRSSWLRTVAHVPVALMLAFVHAAGEAVGACYGMGTAAREYARLEYDRLGSVLPADRHLLVSSADTIPLAAPGEPCTANEAHPWPTPVEHRT